MSTPLGSPSHPKSPSTSSQSRHSRKRTLDEIETPATSRAQRKMEAGLIRTPPRSHQASESNPEAPRTVRRETPNGAATHDLHNGTDHDPNPAPTNNLQKEEGMIDDAIPEGPEPGTPLEPYDWSDLERRFDAAMEERLQVEQGIQQDFQKLTEVFATWAQTPSEHVSERAYKRLRTLTTSVKLSEETIEQKRNHYVTVVKAFQTALDLLRDP